MTTTNKRQCPGDNPGYVYLLEAGPFHKIGRAQTVGFRLKSIRHNVMPREARKYPIVAVHTIRCLDTVSVERALHRRFRRQRIVGEWFSLSTADIEWICQQTEQIVLDSEPGDLLVRNKKPGQAQS